MVKRVDAQGQQLGAQHNTVGVEAGAGKQEMLDGVLRVPAPGAVGVGGQAEAVEMSGEPGVSQTEAGESDIQRMGLFPHPRLWGGVTAILPHGGETEGIWQGGIPPGAAGTSDDAFGGAERQGEWRCVWVSECHLCSSISDVIAPDARVGRDPLEFYNPALAGEQKESALGALD